MANNFISIDNFKNIFKVLTKYSKTKYDTKLDLTEYKPIIFDMMKTIRKRFKQSISKNVANKLCIEMCRKIIDKNQSKTFFKTAYPENTVFNDIGIGRGQEDGFQGNENVYPVVDGQNFRNTDLSQRDINEIRTDRMFGREPSSINNMIFDKEIKIKEDLDRNVQNYFIYKNTDKNQTNPVDLTQPLKQYREDLIIAPDEYNKTLSKYIKEAYLFIDSRDRNTDLYDINRYVMDLTKEYVSVINLELVSADIPNSSYVINENNNQLCFQETTGVDLVATIPIGNYTLTTLAAQIQVELNTIGQSTYTVAESTFLRISEVLTGPSQIVSPPDAYKAFDVNFDNHWTSTGLNESITYDFGEPRVVNRYRFICNGFVGRPKTWVVEVSNDKNTWLQIDSRVNINTPYATYVDYYVPSNAFGARYFRITVSDSSNAIDFHFTKIEIFQAIEDRLTLSSDLTGGDGVFNMDFRGRTINAGTVTLYKDRTIGEIIGFEPEFYSNFTSYTSPNKIILQVDKQLFLSIKDFTNVDLINGNNNDKFMQITLTSEKGQYTYFNNKYNEYLKDKNNYIYYTSNLINMKKLIISFQDRNNRPYNFNGINHNLLFRITYFDGRVQLPNN